jgi:uncharacterized membrane protein YqjE
MFFLNTSKPIVEISAQLDLLYLILACVGLVIVMVCIGSYLFGYGKSLQDNVQQIKALGVDMKISVITVCILVGIALIVPIVWKSFNDTVSALNNTRIKLENDNKTIAEERDQIRHDLELVQSRIVRDQVVLLELDGIPFDQFPQKSNISVGYYNSQAEFPQAIPYDIVCDGKVKRLQVILKNVNSDTEFPRLEVVQTNPDRKWVYENVKPCGAPIFVLRNAKETLQ